MPKDKKDYKKLVKAAFDDKVSNVVYLLKFLDSKGGPELIREYYAEAIPNFFKKYSSPGETVKKLYRFWLKRNPVNNLKKVIDSIREGSEFYLPPENFKISQEDEGNEIVSTIKCKYLKNITKQAKKYQCDFDTREYYCKQACIPLLTVLYSEFYLDLSIELTKQGCIQKVRINKELLDKE